VCADGRHRIYRGEIAHENHRIESWGVTDLTAVNDDAATGTSGQYFIGLRLCLSLHLVIPPPSLIVVCRYPKGASTPRRVFKNACAIVEQIATIPVYSCSQTLRQ